MVEWPKMFSTAMFLCETIKSKIRESTLTNFDDVEKYIIYIKNNLSLITHSANKDKTMHNDLLIYLFNQLHQKVFRPTTTSIHT